MNLISLLKSLLRLGKKNSPKPLKEELTDIKGVGEEYATRLIQTYKTKEKIKKAKDLEIWLPDHIAAKVKKHLR